MRYVGRKKSKVYKKPVKAKPKISKNLKAAVQKIVMKNVETKSAYRAEAGSGINSGINSATDAYQLVPNILQGTSDSTRIGDQIRGQVLRIKGHINTALSLTTSATCRLGVRMMIVQPKQYSNFAQIQANAAIWLQYLLKKGSTTVGFTGITTDLYADVNTDAITCYYDKVMYINTPFLQTAVGDTTIYNSVKFFSKTINLRNKLLKYDSNIDSGLTPSNYNPVLLIGYIRLDGSAPDTTAHISLHYDAYLNYEDA